MSSEFWLKLYNRTRKRKTIQSEVIRQSALLLLPRLLKIRQSISIPPRIITLGSWRPAQLNLHARLSALPPKR